MRETTIAAPARAAIARPTPAAAPDSALAVLSEAPASLAEEVVALPLEVLPPLEPPLELEETELELLPEEEPEEEPAEVVLPSPELVVPYS